jgi:cytochrome c oxidase cbb3-type subunit 3
MRTVQATAEKIKEGQVLFTTCGACHGADGRGRIGVGPSLASPTFLAAASDQMLIEVISKGRMGTTMIGWGAIYKPEQVESLVAYIRSWRSVDAVLLDERPVDGDAANGEKLFHDICASCHGRTGAGYQETANGTGIGRKVFLDAASDGYLRYIIKHGKSQTQMRPFDGSSTMAVANLTDPEIEDAIAFLRQNAW